VSEIDRIAQAVDFNGIALLDGSTTQIEFAIGDGSTTGVDTISVSIDNIRTSALTDGNTALSAIDIGSSGDVSSALASIDAAITTVNTFRARLGAAENRLTSAIGNLANQVESLSAAESRIRDVDVARESADLTRNSIIQQSALSVLAQANLQPQSALSLLTG